jgi:DNA repair protein RadC
MSRNVKTASPPARTVDVIAPEISRRARVEGSRAVRATAVIAVHNHPTADPSPSEIDVRLTRKLERAGDMLEIELLNHIISGNGSQRSSFTDQGLFTVAMRGR